MRARGRKNDEVRKITIINNYLKFPGGSVMMEMGDTKVICTATVEEKVPPFLKGTGQGWLTAEYAMLPGATQVRNPRESSMGRIGGRTHEIQRLIGRSLRAVTDLGLVGERTIYIDCDVLQADGGTRTASITGGFIALVGLMRNLMKEEIVTHFPIKDYVCAVSCGVVAGEILVDLDYEEDSQAEVDMNFVMTGQGLFVEVQGTAERAPFGFDLLKEMSLLALKAKDELVAKQKEILGALV